MRILESEERGIKGHGLLCGLQQSNAHTIRCVMVQSNGTSAIGVDLFDHIRSFPYRGNFTIAVAKAVYKHTDRIIEIGSFAVGSINRLSTFC